MQELDTNQVSNILEKGVYSILCKINNKIYIGSTSMTFSKRFFHHISCLRNNKHKNKYLQNVYNKYGEENIKFNIIEVVKDKSKILEREQFYIDEYKTNYPDLILNINPLASGTSNLSQETIDKRNNSINLFRKECLQYFDLLKSKKITIEEIPKKFITQITYWTSSHKNIGQYSKGTSPWNKGKQYISTEHLKVPKKKQASRENFKNNIRSKLPKIEIYDLNNNLLGKWNCAKEIEEYSTSNEFNLPIMSRFPNGKQNKKVNLLCSSNINKSCKTGKSYKGLYFKFVNNTETASIKSLEFGETLAVDNTEPMPQNS